MSNQIGISIENIAPPSYDQSTLEPSHYPMALTPVQIPMNTSTNSPTFFPPPSSYPSEFIQIANQSSGKSEMLMHLNQVPVRKVSQPEYVNGECPRPDIAKSMTVEGVEYSNLDPGCTIDFCEKCNKKVHF